ncbi:MAG TPA: hypothetical protein VHE80_05715, partial [Acidimicrobiales bacterium]|nr:hypothetical protein [Acidimicrobiales bacterium]
MRPRALRVALMAAALAMAWTLVPVPLAWSAPRVQLAELAAGAARVLPLPFQASHLGVRWEGSEEATVEVRTALVPGVWGPWQPVAVAHDLGDPDRGRVLSGLLRADGARYAQARAHGDARDVTVVAIDSVNGPRRLVRARPA